MKLLNFRCPKCGKDREEIEVKGFMIEVFCPDCNVAMEPFNFKNNGHRVWINDRETK